MLGALYGLLSPAGSRGRLSTLIFHRVLREPDPLFPGEVDARRFEAICRWLREWFNVLPLEQAARRLLDGTLPARALAITFDDGYADNHDLASPILRAHGLSATFFVATGFLDGGRMWNDTVIEALRRTTASSIDAGAAGIASAGRLALGSPGERRRAIDVVLDHCRYLPGAERDHVVGAVARASGATLPDGLMMSSEQVAALHRCGMGLGGHTVSHPILAKLDDATARREIAEGKARLEAISQAPVTVFAYPNGKPGRDYHGGSVALVREAGFACAVSTAWGSAGAGSDPLQLPRFTPWDRSRVGFGLRLARNLRGEAAAVAAAA